MLGEWDSAIEETVSNRKMESELWQLWHDVKIAVLWCAVALQELPLPPNVEWPKGAKARRVAEAVFADMRKLLG